MNPSQEETELLRQADSAFDALLDLSDAEREVALQRLSDQPALHALLVRMLDAHLRPGILDAAPPPVSGAPRSIGPWRIGDEVGRGGMAVVYRAERDLGDGVQVAAVKLLTIGALATHGSERFLREQAILGKLDHPYIAGLLDAGVLADGTPWLAMALIDGERIDAWCASRKLDTRAVVRLFLDVCDAVDHAHRRLIVHRDLKPSNILVDTSGRVRLLDFGIARLLDDGMPDATATALRALTPRYAAPEQFSAEPTTTATDVFGLGAVLYQLLAGRPPRLSDDAREHTITLPSRAARQNAELAEPRRVERSRELVGDLDTILLKALAQEPERRYPSAQAMAADLRAWIAHRPILARPGSIVYRMGRFLRRNRLAAMLATLATVFAAAGIWQITNHSQRAEEQARRAVQVRDFLAEVLNSAEPTSGPVPSLVDVLDEASKRAREKLLIADPLAAADVLMITGTTYSTADVKHKAKVDLELAYQLLSESRQQPASESADVLWQQAVNAKQAGNLDESIALYGQALEWNGLTDNNVLQRIKIEKSLASAQASAGQADVAEMTLRRLLDSVDSDGIRDTQVHLDLLNSLNFVLAVKKVGLPEQLTLNAERLEVTKRLYGADSGWYGYALADSVATLRNAGEMEQAVRNGRAAVEITDAVFTEPHMFSAVANCNFAALLKMQGKMEQALPYYDREIKIDEALARNDLHAESCRRGRADTHIALGNFELARVDLAKDRAMLEKLGKQKSKPWLANCGSEAAMLVREQELDAATRLLERCESEHTPEKASAVDEFDLARVEVMLIRREWISAATQLQALRSRLPPKPASRAWLRPWMLSVHAANQSGDEAALQEFTEQILAITPVAGMRDLSITAPCLNGPQTLSDCMALP